MDAHIAITVASYLSINHANIFLGFIGLTEDVITLNMAADAAYLRSSPRRLDVLRILKYPPFLMTAVNDTHANLECLDQGGANYFGNLRVSSFQWLGNYTQRYPCAILRVIDDNRGAFIKYCKQVPEDTRYADVLSTLNSTSTMHYLKRNKMPEWSLNRHLIDPSLKNLLFLINKINVDPKAYTMPYILVSYVTYSKDRSNTQRCQLILFKKYYRYFLDSPTELRQLAMAVFGSAKELHKWISTYQEDIVKLRRAVYSL